MGPPEIRSDLEFEILTTKYGSFGYSRYQNFAYRRLRKKWNIQHTQTKKSVGIPRIKIYLTTLAIFWVQIYNERNV